VVIDAGFWQPQLLPTEQATSKLVFLLVCANAEDAQFFLMLILYW
jgi:hypothetical protein